MTNKPATAIITGAGGFVGRHLIAEMESNTSWTLIGLGRSSTRFGARTSVLACDLQNAELVGRVLRRYRPNKVIHLAAQSYVPQAFAEPAATITNNVVAQVNLLEGCRLAGIDPAVIVVGSAEQYGLATEAEMPLVETQPFRPTNPYAVSKIAQDMLGLQYALSYGMHIIRVRPFNHFGPGQSDRFVMSGFARQIAQAELGHAEPVVLTGNLDARRDFLDVRDVARAYRMILEADVPPDAYNLASGSAHRIGDLLDMLIALSPLSIGIRQDPERMRPSDTPILAGDASKLRDACGWEPATPIEVTLKDTLEYWRATLTANRREMRLE